MRRLTRCALGAALVVALFYPAWAFAQAPSAPPAVPQAFGAEASAVGVRLSWSAVPGARSYAIHRRDGTAPWAWLGAVLAPDTAFLDLAVPAGAVYRVRALADTDASDWTPEVTVTAAPLAVGPVVTGYRVANGALFPPSVKPGDSVTILGESFGTATGTVFFDSAPWTVVTWADTSILVRVPATQGATANPGALAVRRADGRWYVGRSFPVPAP